MLKPELKLKHSMGYIAKIEELLGDHLSGFYPCDYISDTDEPEEESEEE